MGLMSKTQFVSWIDALYDVFVAVRSANDTMNASLLLLVNAKSFFDTINDVNAPNADVIIPFADQANKLDSLMTNGNDATALIRSMAPVRQQIPCFINHLKRIATETLPEASIDQYLITQGIDEDETLVKVNDIWVTLANQYLQARAVPATSVITFITATYTALTDAWAITEGAKLFTGSFYTQKMPSKWDNFAPSRLSVSKNGTENVTVDITVVGVSSTGNIVSTTFTGITLNGTAAVLLDASKLYVSVEAVTISGTLTVDTIVTIKNVLP